MDEMKEVAKAAEVVGETAKNTVTLHDGQEVEIYKCKTRQVGMVLQLVATLFAELGVRKLGDVPTMNLDDPTILLKLIAKATQDVYLVAVELSSISDVAAFEDLEVDDALVILMKEFEVNKDFFLTRVLPQIENL